MIGEPAPHEAYVDVFGTVVAIGFHGDEAGELADGARRAWSRCLVPGGSTIGERIEVHVEPGSAFVRIEHEIYASEAAPALELLTQTVTVAGLARSAGRLLMLHACGLADPATGRTAVLVGPSGVGKSTACQVHGPRWGYVSDECIAFDQDGALLPYPKPLSLDRGGAVKDQVGPDQLGLAAAPDALVPAAVILLDRREGAPIEVRRLPVTEAVARLAEHTSFLSALPQPLRRIAELVRQAGCHEVTYGSTAELGDVLESVLGRGA